MLRARAAMESRKSAAVERIASPPSYYDAESEQEHRIIGEGISGRVYRPELPCASGAKLCPDDKHCVGKVFKWDADLATEQANHARVHAVDPAGDFTAVLYGDCATPIGNQLVYSDAGEPLEVASTGSMLRLGLLQVFENLQPLFGALAAMAERGLVHGDVHGSNIVFMPPRGPLRFIDFGRGNDDGTRNTDVEGFGSTMLAELEKWAAAKRTVDGLSEEAELQLSHATRLLTLMNTGAVNASDAAAHFTAIVDGARRGLAHERPRCSMTGKFVRAERARSPAARTKTSE